MTDTPVSVGSSLCDDDGLVDPDSDSEVTVTFSHISLL